MAVKKKKKEEEDFKLIMSTMDRDKIEAMRGREHLINKMQVCYRCVVEMRVFGIAKPQSFIIISNYCVYGLICFGA